MAKAFVFLDCAVVSPHLALGEASIVPLLDVVPCSVNFSTAPLLGGVVPKVSLWMARLSSRFAPLVNLPTAPLLGRIPRSAN